jgi:hypothetical protein
MVTSITQVVRLDNLTLLAAFIKTGVSFQNDLSSNLIKIIDLLNLKPVFTVELESGKPTLVWTKGATDAVKIKVKRVMGPSPGPPPPINLDEFAFLAIDTQPDYTDTTPLPPYGETATWIYVMIYMMDDEEVGQWSEPVIVTVVGTP